MMRIRPMLAALIAAALLPATASAATTEVSNADQLKSAASSAAKGDTIRMKPGAYVANIVVKSDGVTITADPGAVLVNSDTTTPTLSYSATSGDPDVVVGLLVFNTGTQPAVQASASGMTVTRSVLYSVKGDALLSAATGGTSQSVPARTIAIDSSWLVGGANGIRATSANSLPVQTIGATTITARHVSVIAPNAVNVDSSGATGAAAVPVVNPTGTPTGDITATITDSILLGKRVAKANTSVPNKATITATTRDYTDDNTAIASTIFVNSGRLNLHLRADAPGSILDQGAPGAGANDIDIDGEVRPSGPTDLGADEFTNHPPTAALKVSGSPAREGKLVVLDASDSSDPDTAVGGGITGYQWDFGDGQTATTATPATNHTYTKRGSYTVTVTVTDKQGATATASQPVTVIDGSVPTITVSQPVARKALSFYAKKDKRKRISAVFFGTATDDTGLKGVALALKVKGSTGANCSWFDGKSKIVTRSCGAPVWFLAPLDGSSWRFSVPKAFRIPRGGARLYAVAVDTAGNASAPASISFVVR